MKKSQAILASVVILIFVLILQSVLASELDADSFETDADAEAEAVVNVDIIPNIFSQTIEPCSPAVFSITLKNTGDFEESYSFSLKGVSGAEISPSETVLQPNEQKEVLVKFVPDDCSLFGEFLIVFSAQTAQTRLVADIDLSLIINPSDVLSIGAGIDKIVAPRSLSIAKIFARNEGDEKAEYTLSIEGPSWVKLDSDKTSADANSETTILLVINPDESAKKGSYDVTLSAHSKISNRIYSKTFAIQISDKGILYSTLGKIKALFGLLASKYKYSVVAVVLLIIVYVIGRYARKKPDEDEDYYADEERVEKKPTDIIDSKTRKIVEKELRSQFKLIPKTTVVSPNVWPKLILRALALLIIAGIFVAGYFLRDLLSVYLDYAALGVLILVLWIVFTKILRKFSVSKKFKLLLKGDSADFLTNWKTGLLRLAFEAVDNVENLRVRTKKGMNGFVSPDSSVYSAVKITTNCDESLLNNISLTFKIKKAWLARLGASEKDAKIVSFEKNRWKKLESNIVGADEKFVYLDAFANFVGTFAVVCKNKLVEQKQDVVQKPIVEKKIVAEKPSKKASSKKSKTSGSKVSAYIVLFILFALVIGAFAYLYQISPPAPLAVNGIPAQVWVMDKTHTLDVSKYFNDPDNDALTFTASPVENIKIEFNNGIATFTPDSGWSGTRLTTFTATDTVNTNASSNEVSLVVRKNILPASIQQYLPQIIGGALFVIVVVILLVFRDKIIELLDDEDD